MNQFDNSTSLASTPVPKIPEGWDPSTPDIYVIGSNAGGAQKSKTAKYLASVAKAAGHKIMLVDADPGIGSLSASLAVGEYAVDEFPTEESATYGASLLAKAKALGATIIIIDLGANEMLRGAMSRTVKAMLEHTKRAGCRTYVILSLIPFKVGLDDDADNFGNRFRRVATIATFYHGREKGGDFSKIDGLKDTFDLTAEVPSDELAIVGLIANQRVLPLDYARRPQPGFTMAAAWVARNLLKFAKQDAVQHMLDSAAAWPELEQLAQRAPVRSYTARTNSWQVHDVALAADADAISAEWALKRLARDAEDTVLLAAARAFIDASTAAEAAHRATKLSI